MPGARGLPSAPAQEAASPRGPRRPCHRRQPRRADGPASGWLSELRGATPSVPTASEPSTSASPAAGLTADGGTSRARSPGRPLRRLGQGPGARAGRDRWKHGAADRGGDAAVWAWAPGPSHRLPGIPPRQEPQHRAQGAGSPWSRMSGASPRHGSSPGMVANAPFRQPLASGQDVRRAGRSKHSACRPHGPRRRGCKQPGGSAVRTGARGSGYSVRAAGSGVARLHSRTSTAPGSQHVVNTPQKQTFPSSFAGPPRKLRIFTGCKASGIQPARCQNSQRGTRNSYCN